MNPTLQDPTGRARAPEVGPFGHMDHVVYADFENGKLFQELYDRGCRLLADGGRPLSLFWDTSTVDAALRQQ